MAASSTSQVYVHVMEDVMSKVREEFVNNNGGPGEEVLNELKSMWESKMIKAGVIFGPKESSGASKPTPCDPTTMVHNLNVSSTGEYVTPTVDMLFPPNPRQTPIQTPLSRTGDSYMYNTPIGLSDNPSFGHDYGGNVEIKGGRPDSYMMSAQTPIQTSLLGTGDSYMYNTHVGPSDNSSFGHDYGDSVEINGGRPDSYMMSTQTPIQPPLPGTRDISMYNIPNGHSDYPSFGYDYGGNVEIKGGRPDSYMMSTQTQIQTHLPGTRDISMYNIPNGPSDYSSFGFDYGGNMQIKGARPDSYMMSAQTSIQTPLPGTRDISMHNIPNGPSDYPSFGHDYGGNVEIKAGRPDSYMQSPSPWMNQRSSLNVAYVDGLNIADRGNPNQHLTHENIQDFFAMSSWKRKRDEFASQYNVGGYTPMNDGVSGSASRNFEIELYGQGISIDVGHSTSVEKMTAHLEMPASQIPQLDGPSADDDDVLSTPNIYNHGGTITQDCNIANKPAPLEAPANTPTLVAQNEGDEKDDGDELPLNENDDDDDDVDDLDKEGEDQYTKQLVLCKFDKVVRNKNKWKCTLKEGIMHINNMDTLFGKANGEFDF